MPYSGPTKLSRRVALRGIDNALTTRPVSWRPRNRACTVGQQEVNRLDKADSPLRNIITSIGYYFVAFYLNDRGRFLDLTPYRR